MGYNMWGVRFDDREFNIGDEIPRSHQFEGDNQIDTGEELSGTCALYVSDETNFLDYLDGKLEADCRELEKYEKALTARYSENHIYLVAINSTWGYEWGEDDGEIVMSGAEVVRVIK